MDGCFQCGKPLQNYLGTAATPPSSGLPSAEISEVGSSTTLRIISGENYMFSIRLEGLLLQAGIYIYIYIELL